MYMIAHLQNLTNFFPFRYNLPAHSFNQLPTCGSWEADQIFGPTALLKAKLTVDVSAISRHFELIVFEDDIFAIVAEPVANFQLCRGQVGQIDNHGA